MPEYLYILSNPSMPGLLKVGWTSDFPETRRLQELFTTGVPEPFRLEFCLEVVNGLGAEKKAHKALEMYRYRANREFFKIDVGNAVRLVLASMNEFKIVKQENKKEILEVEDKILKKKQTEIIATIFSLKEKIKKDEGIINNLKEINIFLNEKIILISKEIDNDNSIGANKYSSTDTNGFGYWSYCLGGSLMCFVAIAFILSICFSSPAAKVITGGLLFATIFIYLNGREWNKTFNNSISESQNKYNCFNRVKNQLDGNNLKLKELAENLEKENTELSTKMNELHQTIEDIKKIGEKINDEKEKNKLIRAY
jgi:hypothetical protein